MLNFVISNSSNRLTSPESERSFSQSEVIGKFMGFLEPPLQGEAV